MNIRDALSRAVGRATGTGGGTVAEMVGKLGGTKQAAAELGVTQRTVQRWVKSERETGARHARKAPARQVAKLRKATQAELRRRGAKLGGVGQVGPGFDGGYLSKRDLSKANQGTGIDLTPDQISAILDALNSGDKEAAENLLGAAVAENYLGDADTGWSFGDMDSFNLS